MELALIFGLYALIPLLICWLYKRLKLKGLIIFTHLVAGLVILCLPTVMIIVENWLNPPTQEEWCGTPDVMLNIANVVVMIPFTQVLILLFNKQFKNEYFPNG